MTREYQFTTGPETSDQPATGTPSDDADLVNKGYADGRYMQGQRAVADITALKAIAIADRADGNLINILSLNVLYIFDQGSSATGDDNFVVAPDAGSGRWLKATGTAGNKAAQFDGISPNTTKGDLTVYNGTNNVRQAVGSDGQFLQADSTQSTGYKFANPSSTLSQNNLGDAGYTILDGDGFDVIAVGQSANLTAGRTVTLPTAADNTNRRITVIKADTAAFDVTVDGEGSEVVGPGGATTITLSEEGDGVTLICDGTEWRTVQAAAPATADIAGVTKLPQGERRVTGGAGHGSTNTVIRRFQNNVIVSGSSITFADSATLGATFTINEDGVYAISYGDAGPNGSGGGAFGISINSTQLTTSIAGITNADRLAYGVTDTSSELGNVDVTVRLSAGDVIRAHTAGTVNNTSDVSVWFHIVQVTKF